MHTHTRTRAHTRTFCADAVARMDRVAVLAWLRPDAPVELRLQASLIDDRLLAGSVPQPEDWIRAWRAARTPKSWQAAAESCESEHYIRHSRDRSVGARALEQQARVMREAMRQDKREALRRATCISFSFNDRGTSWCCIEPTPLERFPLPHRRGMQCHLGRRLRQRTSSAASSA